MLNKNNLGNKAYNLRLLEQKGFNIPSFFVLPYSEIDKENLDGIEKKIKDSIKDKNKDFIIRSSASCEEN